MAICVMAVVGEAPCQCLTCGGHQITSPALIVLYRASPCLCPANASGHDQVLPCRVHVPGGSGPWLEGDIRTGNVRRIIGRKQRVDTDMAGKKFGRPFRGRL